MAERYFFYSNIVEQKFRLYSIKMAEIAEKPLPHRGVAGMLALSNNAGRRFGPPAGKR